MNTQQETFSPLSEAWTQNLSPEQFDIKQGLASVRRLCVNHRSVDQETRILFEMMGNVLDGLERAFDHHFSQDLGQEISPKSDEPWD